MKNLLVALILLLLPTLATAKPTLRIYAVQSYGVNHFCGAPQLQGFKYELEKYKNQYTFILHTFYMHSRLVYTSDVERRRIAKVILKRIEAFHPDVVVLFDDNAFRYIAPHLPSNIPIIFSGMNDSFQDYLQRFPQLKHRKIAGVEERVVFDKKFKLFLKKNIDIVYIFYDDTPTSYYMQSNFLEQFSILKQYDSKDFLSLQVQVVHISTVPDVINILTNYCKLPTRKLYVIALQRIYDPELGKDLSKPQIFKIFEKYNKCCNGGFEVTANVYAVRYITMAYGPDFFQMGETAADLMIKGLTQGTYVITRITPRFYVSKTQLRRICRYANFIDENIDEFTRVYP